jgi:serine/threonine-protein kinase
VHFIAQEYVQGMNLREYLNRRGPPELLIAYHIMRQVAAALTAAGDAGIVHRDIKPENILITRKGETKVADFGLAQLAESEHRVHLTQAGMTMGTPVYMSPEQINGEGVDHRSDIYSFGVTCYRLLAGRPPFQGETSLTLAMQHLTKTPEPLSGLRPDLPPVVCEIVHKMMAREPAQRYQHARDITQDLKRVAKLLKADPQGAAAVKLAQMTPRPSSANWREAFFAWSWTRHLLFLAVAAILLASLSAGIGWWMRPSNPLLATVTKPDPIRKQDSAKAQYDLARQLHSDEEAWRAVIANFPNDRTYVPQAQEHLAVLCLQSRRLDEAKRLFDDLAAMGRENASAAAAGIAGKAIIASLQGNYKESQRLIVSELGDLAHRRDQLPEDLWFLLSRAGRENSQHLGEEAKKQLKELFEEEP